MRADQLGAGVRTEGRTVTRRPRGLAGEPDPWPGHACGGRAEGRTRSAQRDSVVEPAADRGDRNPEPHRKTRCIAAAGAQGSQGMPRRGPAQAGRRRDLLRGAAGHRQGQVRMTDADFSPRKRSSDADFSSRKRSSDADFSSRKRSSVVIEKYPDTDALVAAAGDRLVGAITDAIDKRGKAQIVLTG